MTDPDHAPVSPFDPLITAGLNQVGITKPNDVQNRVWPELLARRDVLLIAQTGSGKTAAYAAPAFQHLLACRGEREPGAPRVLILAPTRELVTQIAGVCRQIGRRLPFRTRLLCGGLPKDAQIEALAEGVDIAVATPGRLIDLLTSGSCRLDLTTLLIVDEVDQMLDEDFLAAMDQIVPYLPRERQAMMCSATMPPTGRALANRLLYKPVTLEFESQTVTPRRIKQRAMFVETEEKLATLTRLCAETQGRQIVFIRTKASVDQIGKHLRKTGLPIAVLHGDLAQGARQKAVDALRSGAARILLTTDVAARGLDIDDVALVLNYDLPEKAETYVHRIGRTARAGKRGAALSFCTRDERLLLRAIEKEIGYRISIIS
ncbi:DEAD/DEAH box helicase [Asaia krungthepensis]|uniref:RNA helicase n=1 Tax=Asaia krungthepensis NRIC 0535 TaxID=1307925 RepID=A0ABQ0Q2Y0_9PROT|nr:DEAD/DEAH box helicase [Asaia krungthepensis]GBQ88839.1 RNA helicase [Asaia krungthepensis NRIC 0535]